MKWIGQHIYDLVSRFRDDVYLEDLTTTTETDVLVVDSTGLVSKSTSVAGDLTAIVAGVGLSGTSLSGPIPTLTLDLSELSVVTPASGDWFATLDSDGSTEQLTSLSAFATLLAGTASSTGLSASSSVLSISDLHPVGVDGSDNQVLTDTGSGTINSETYFTFENTGNVSTLSLLSNQDTGDLFKIATTTHGATTITTIDDNVAAASLDFVIDGPTKFDCLGVEVENN